MSKPITWPSVPGMTYLVCGSFVVSAATRGDGGAAVGFGAGVTPGGSVGFGRAAEPPAPPGHVFGTSLAAGLPDAAGLALAAPDAAGLALAAEAAGLALVAADTTGLALTAALAAAEEGLVAAVDAGDAEPLLAGAAPPQAARRIALVRTPRSFDCVTTFLRVRYELRGSIPPWRSRISTPRAALVIKPRMPAGGADDLGRLT